MGFRQELNQLKKTPQEYQQEQLAIAEKKRNEAIQQYGNNLIHALQDQMKQDAQCGKVRGNRLSGTLRIDAFVKPVVETEFIRRGWGFFVNEHVWRYRLSPTDDIDDIFKILQQYADQEDISLSKLYYVDSEGISYRRRYATAISDNVSKKFYYAVDYSITL